MQNSLLEHEKKTRVPTMKFDKFNDWMENNIAYIVTATLMFILWWLVQFGIIGGKKP